jgi:rare lipoprotein A
MTLEATRTLEEGRGLPLRAALLALAAASLAACAGGPRPQLGVGGEPTARYAPRGTAKPYQINGVWYYPKEQPNYDEIGIASWYGQQFHNHYTADGEIFDMRVPSAAHKTLPLPSLVEVTNLANGRTIVVRVNDRGPFVGGRLIDLSQAAAEELGFVASGVTKVRVRYVGQAQAPPEPKQEQASNSRLPQPKAPAIRLAEAPLQLAQAAAPPSPAAPAVAPVTTPAEAPLLTAAAAAPVGESPLASLPIAGARPYLAPPASGGLADVDSLLADNAPTTPIAAMPTAATPMPAPMPTAEPAAGFEVQAGVFSSRANAERLVSRLTGAGAPAIEPFDRNGQTLYRVVVRGFSNPADAAAVSRQAAAFGAPDARVIAGS